MSGASRLYQEANNGPHAYKLTELLESVQGVIERAFNGRYWIVAEVSEPGHNARSGHWYLQLAQVEDNKLVARIQANMWAGVASKIVPKFKAITGSTIEAGMQLMLYVSVSMNALYGLSLTVHDINPEFTLGHLERIKQETISRLQAEGVFNLNRLQHLPQFIQKVAVISSPTAAGWGDFKKQIDQSPVGNFISLTLFPAIMQGEATTSSILKVLDQIATQIDNFDAIALIRGGGSRMDLSAFDDYILACHLANFPLPIITGIGHERDESVADLVAHTRLKTPTAVAEFLLRRAEEAILRLLNAEQALAQLLQNWQNAAQQRAQLSTLRIQSLLASAERTVSLHLGKLTQKVQSQLVSVTERSKARLLQAKIKLTHIVGNTTTHTTQQIKDLTTRTLLRLAKVSSQQQHQEQLLQHLSTRTERLLTQLPPSQEQRLKILEQTGKLYDPTATMQRGYLPVTQNGQKVTATTTINPSAPLHITLLDGSIEASINTINKEEL